MSHLKERKEKNCLNCNAQVAGRFCHVCGQENIEPKESAWHLVVHFFEDITHFDGKFFTTLWLLIRKPGFLSAEYARGRRASYLNPIRMYVFTSALFFLVFFTVYKVDDEKMDIVKIDINGKLFSEVVAMDSTQFADFTRTINKGDKKPDKPMTMQEFVKYYDSTETAFKKSLEFTSTEYKSVHEYDSLLKAGKVKDGWLKRLWQHRQLEINEKYKDSNKKIIKVILEAFVHKLPQMLFISLPILALLLRLLYIRRKEFYYVNHGIFSIHLYIFIFIALLFSFGLNKLHTEIGWGIFSFIKNLIAIAIFFYLYKAMRNFYHQRRAKTVLKYFILLFLFLFVMIIVFSLFFLLSAFTI